MGERPGWLRALIDQEVHDRLRCDPRTLEQPGTLLGWPQDRIFTDALKGGLADFDAPVGSLSGADRALLYARFNLPRHLDELGEAFGQLFQASGRAGDPTVVDLGCGPFTAGLALAAALGPEAVFRYHGIDRATSMRGLGRRFAEGARERGAFHPKTTWAFGSDLDAHDFGAPSGDTTVVVASYLFANPSVDPQALAAGVLRALERIGPGPAAFLYTNSAAPRLNESFRPFSDALVEDGFRVVTDGTERFERTRNPTDLHYALLYREERTEVDLEGGTP
jgi:SAM-dependent methyltransferase